MKFLITGATGFVGTEILPQIAKEAEKIWVLVRPESINKARQKWSSQFKNVEWVSADLTNANVLTDSESLKMISEATDVLHMAALYDLEATESAAYMTNIVGTQNLLDLANQLPRLKRFHHVSTIAIAGNFQGVMRESMFNVGQKHLNAYAQTKYRSEGLVGSWKNPSVKKVIYRLGVVVGNSKTGFIPKVDGPYYFYNSIKNHPRIWRVLGATGFLPIPCSNEAKIPLIPVDIAATHIAFMATHPNESRGELTTYHVIGRHVPVVKVLQAGLDEFKIQTQIIAAPRFAFPKWVLDGLSIPEAMIDYLYSKATFDTSNIDQDFPHLKNLSFDEILPSLFLTLRNQEQR
jgi:thioester reductase-like protein